MSDQSPSAPVADGDAPPSAAVHKRSGAGRPFGDCGAPGPSEHGVLPPVANTGALPGVRAPEADPGSLSGSATPYYEADGIILWHGDCRDVTAWLAADVLVTDPPYGGQNSPAEIEERYCDLIASRLAQGDLFGGAA